MKKPAIVSLLIALLVAVLVAGSAGSAFGHGISHNGCTAVDQVYGQQPALGQLLDPLKSTACDGYQGPVYLP